MREQPTPRPACDGDRDGRQWEGVEAPVRLDLLVRQVMDEERARLAAEDPSRDLARHGQQAAGDAGEPPGS